jgi:hypothetical protein
MLIGLPEMCSVWKTNNKGNKLKVVPGGMHSIVYVIHYA